MAPLNTLTVQDLLWLNRELTAEEQTFDVNALEEAVYYQFSYGDSTDVARQAARLLIGFVKQAPFKEGNEACALVSTVAFLKMNGYSTDLTLMDAVEMRADPTSARDMMAAKMTEAGNPTIDSQSAMKSAIKSTGILVSE
jgi:prophage maintenance system killer protein